jgi:hypothetical protein
MKSTGNSIVRRLADWLEFDAALSRSPKRVAEYLADTSKRFEEKFNALCSDVDVKLLVAAEEEIERRNAIRVHEHKFRRARLRAQRQRELEDSFLNLKPFK